MGFEVRCNTQQLKPTPTSRFDISQTLEGHLNSGPSSDGRPLARRRQDDFAIISRLRRYSGRRGRRPWGSGLDLHAVPIYVCRTSTPALSFKPDFQPSVKFHSAIIAPPTACEPKISRVLHTSSLRFNCSQCLKFYK